MKPTTRTFIAVEITPAVRQRAGELIEHLRSAGADVKWVEPQNLHLTLKFLGDVPTEQIAEVSQAVHQAVREVQPFNLEIRGAGAFPGVHRPRTIWLGSGDGEAAMADLSGRIEKALRQLGFPREARAYRTHLTIGRVRGGGAALAELARRLKEAADFPSGSVPVAEVVVFSSDLTPKGSIYTAMSRLKVEG